MPGAGMQIELAGIQLEPGLKISDLVCGGPDAGTEAAGGRRS